MNISSPNLAGIDFQQFLKIKMAATANFPQIFSTNYSNAVQAIVSRFDVQMSNHNSLLVFELISLLVNLSCELGANNDHI